MSRSLEIVVNIFWIAIIILGSGWILIRALKSSEDPAKTVFKIIFSIALIVGEFFFLRHIIAKLQVGGMLDNAPMAAVITGSIAICGIILAVVWTPHICIFLFSPLTNALDGGNIPPEKKPYYSIAIAKRKRGKPLEAVVELRKQLAKFPTDFEGVMLLANVQAQDMADLQGAEITLNKFCDAPTAPPKQIAAALTQLADWHLKLAQDADSAHMALQKIVERFPDTEISLHAQQRLAHLGGVEKIILASYDRQAVVVPVGVQNLGLMDSTAFIVPEEIAPGKLAETYLKHLAQHPQDIEVREKLAVLYAKDFKRLDLATMELAQLIKEPRHPAKQIAQWLNLLANLQIELGADCATVRETLEKIVERFPTLPVAEIAQRRLARLESELRGQKETPSIKLGVYEQDIGLK